MALRGGTRHVYYITDQGQATSVIKLNYVSRPFGILAVTAVKIAAGFLIFRILGPDSRRLRHGIYALLTINVVVDILAVVLTFAQCDVPAALWDSSLAPVSHCWDPSVDTTYSLFSSSFNVVVDFILAVVPAIIIWPLQLTTRKRIGLSVLFGCGMFSAISSAIKTYHLSAVSARSDPTWDMFDGFIWVSVEIFVLHLCASVPAFKPLWDRVCKRKNNVSLVSYFHRARCM